MRKWLVGLGVVSAPYLMWLAIPKVFRYVIVLGSGTYVLLHLVHFFKELFVASRFAVDLTMIQNFDPLSFVVGMVLTSIIAVITFGRK